MLAIVILLYSFKRFLFLFLSSLSSIASAVLQHSSVCIRWGTKGAWRHNQPMIEPSFRPAFSFRSSAAQCLCMNVNVCVTVYPLISRKLVVVVTGASSAFKKSRHPVKVAQSKPTISKMNTTITPSTKWFFFLLLLLILSGFSPSRTLNITLLYGYIIHQSSP